MLKILRAISSLGTLLVLAAVYVPQAQPPQVSLIHVEIDGLRKNPSPEEHFLQFDTAHWSHS